MKVPEILQVEISQAPESLAAGLSCITRQGLLIEHLTTVSRAQGRTVWEITVEIEPSAQHDLLERLQSLSAVRFIGWSDRALERYQGGKIEMRSRVAISSQQVLRDIYFPGVARVCLAIEQDRGKARDYTYLSRACALVSDGSSVPGVGHVSPRASLPVLEGRAALLASLVGLSGAPLAIESRSVEHFVETVRTIAPSFGAIVLANVRAPRGLEIERRLSAQLNVRVMFDDRDGAAVVVLAALMNSTRKLGITLEDCDVGLIGLGCAGLGIARLLRTRGVHRLCGADLRAEALGRFAELRGQGMTLGQVLARARIIVATTGVAGLIRLAQIEKGQIILALCEPDPEIAPVAALAAGAAIAVDGKSISSVLAWPGLIAGALRAAATKFDDGMWIAAAQALAQAAPEGQLVPDPLDAAAHAAVASAVAAAAV